jgi:hypothetical protein
VTLTFIFAAKKKFYKRGLTTHAYRMDKERPKWLVLTGPVYGWNWKVQAVVLHFEISHLSLKGT